MNLITILLLILSGLIGFAAGRYFARSNKVVNPKPHRLADGTYSVINLDGKDHYFTDEQLAVARNRAVRLK